MSDPVSNAEIEDVLSSIRRLVSENAAPESGSASRERAAPPHDTPAQDKSDKLVLTPAFRVHDVAGQDDGHQTDTNHLSQEPGADQEDAPSEERQDAPATHTLHLTDALSISQEETATTAADSEVSSEHASEDAEQDDLEELAESEAGTAQRGAVWDAPFVASEEMTDDPVAVVEDAQEADGAEREIAGQHDVNAVADGVPDAPSVAPDPSLDHRVAELEAAVNESAVEFEPDLGDAVEDLGPGIFLRRRAEAETELAVVDARQEEPAEVDQNWDAFDAEVDTFVSGGDQIEGEAQALDGADAPIEEPDDAILSDEDEVGLLDEDMLRELVTRLVREELQGAVGEKITRNVRRLVRREVERALTLKSLE